jgi:hypothetical protein
VDIFNTATAADTVKHIEGDKVWAEKAYPTGNVENLDGCGHISQVI